MNFKPSTLAFACTLVFASGCATSQPTPSEMDATPVTPIIVQTSAASKVDAKQGDMKSDVDCTGGLSPSNYYLNVNGEKALETKINATGYGAPPKSFYPEPQRRLMAMRAAKIDAYRSLAERVNGMQIWGGTTIGDMVVEKDRFRVYLDTHLRGARVIAENQQEDGTYETIVEVSVDQGLLKMALPQPNDPCAGKNSAIAPYQNSSHAFKEASFRREIQPREVSNSSNFYYRVD